MPPPARRARAAASLPAYSEHSYGSPEASALSGDSDASAQRRAKKSGRKGGGAKSRACVAAAASVVGCCPAHLPQCRRRPTQDAPTSKPTQPPVLPFDAACCPSSPLRSSAPLPLRPPTRSGAPSMQQQASMRRAPSRPAAVGGVSGGGMPRVASGLNRSRSTRQNGGYGGGADPNDFVGRRVWRLWPSENPPWVEGFVQGWDPGARWGRGGSRQSG